MSKIVFILVSLILLASAVPTFDYNLTLLVKRKFSHLSDTYLDDEYYKFDAPYLRAANQRCVLDKLNLIEIGTSSDADLEKFDAHVAFGDLEEDLSTLVIYTMYSCIDDVEGFTRSYFDRAANDTPRFPIPSDSIECVKNELSLMGCERPLVDSFTGLENHTQTECDEVLFDLKAVNESWDDDYRGCLRIYDEHSLEYSLKFTIMRMEVTRMDVFEEELKKYTREAHLVCEEFVECMIENYL